jgi:excisionase family DNA binding protein
MVQKNTMNNNTNQINKYLKPTTVAEELGINYRTLMTLIHAGDISAIKVGGSYRISRQALDRYIINSTVQTATL